MRNKIMLAAAALLVPALAAAEIFTVASRKANIRSGPGTGYEVLWTVSRYSPLEVIDSDGAWVMVSDYEKDEGWIHRSLLSKNPGVAIKTEKANLREGPGGTYDVLWILDMGYALKIVSSEGSWLKVTDDDEVSGWLHRSVVWGLLGEKEAVY
ncbi:MAG: SH3 domain-containing protein [Elusimicrobiales bacterium]|nr:SH3 domain-containing protein [Elusimicrobiales bacterium]